MSKILVVDDSENIRSVLQMNFEWMGHDVLSAGDGEEAIHLVQRERPDLVILDVMMPRKNGYQVCRQFKSDPRTAHIPVILLTAKNQQEDIFWGKDCGADEYITKPFSTPELEDAVKRLLGSTEEQEMPADEDDGALDGPIEEIISRHLQEGYVCGVCDFRLDSDALDVHRQKYGEIRHREMFESVRGAIESVLTDEGLRPVMEQNGSHFQVLVPCTPERVIRIQELITEDCNRQLLDFYDEADRDRGHVSCRDYRTGEELNVALLSLQSETPKFYNQD